MTVKKQRQVMLIVDDDALLCRLVKERFESPELEVRIAGRASEALEICSESPIDVVLLDQKLPDADGHQLCKTIAERTERAKIIFITAYPTLGNAIEAVRAHAHDYLTKPFELHDLRRVIQSSLRTLHLERIERLHHREIREDKAANVIVGIDEGLDEVQQLVQIASNSTAPVLITGETGTGKNVVARAIHYGHFSGDEPFVCLNCAAIAENLVESEFFGFEKGAFTGANETKEGIFETADGGTLFLDEIGEMPIHLQSKLLGVLEDMKVRRIGGRTTRNVNVRIIAATNANVTDDGIRGMRRDLYFRLGVIHIHIPPLRERAADIPKLCEHLLKKVAPKQAYELSDEELHKLQLYSWPGNVRELRNVLERSVLLRSSEVLSPSRLLASNTRPSIEALPVVSKTLRTLQEVELAHILDVLRQTNGNRKESAEILGISISTLQRRIRENNLEVGPDQSV